MHGIYRQSTITPKHAHRQNEPVANAHNASGIHTHCAARGGAHTTANAVHKGGPEAGWAEREGPGYGAVRCLAQPRRGTAGAKARGGKGADQRRVGERGSAPLRHMERARSAAMASEQNKRAGEGRAADGGRRLFESIPAVMERVPGGQARGGRRFVPSSQAARAESLRVGCVARR